MLLLVIGLGISIAGFAVFDAVLLRDLPYRDAGRLFALWETSPQPGHAAEDIAPANFVDWQRQATGAFAEMGAYANDEFNLAGIGGEPDRIAGQSITAGFFQTIGADAALGRVFTDRDHEPGAPLVVVLSDRLWRRRFAADPRAIGRAVVVNGAPATVIGVMPPSFRFPGDEGDMWAPIGLDADQWISNRGGHFLGAIGRLRDGVTQAAAATELKTIAERLQHEYPRTNTGWGATLVPLREQIVGQTASTVWLLNAAIAAVLVVACANVATLLLASGEERRREMAVRAALGASRRGIAVQLLGESLGLAVVAAIAGVVLAGWILKLVAASLPDGALPVAELAIRPRAVAFAALLSIACGVLFGTAPALHLARVSIRDLLHSAGRGPAASGRQIVRRLLVGGEIALAIVLLVAAALMVESVSRLRDVSPGFDPHDALTMRTVLPVRRYPDVAARTAFYREVLARVGALPGVRAAGVVTFLPLTFGGMSSAITVEGAPRPGPGDQPVAFLRVVSPDYFRAAGIPLRAGRPFRDADDGEAPRVVMVSSTTARRLWNVDRPQDAVGHRVKWGDADSTEPWASVVGVVGDVRQRALDTSPGLDVYVPMPQAPSYPFAMPRDLVVRTAAAPLALAAAVRAAIAEIDSEQPVTDIRTLDAVVDASAASRSLMAQLIGAFSLIAVLISVAGLYGLLSFVVARRRSEVGLRMALGASARSIVGLIVRDGMITTAAGLVCGVAAALAATAMLRSWLFGVAPSDPAAFAAAVLLLATTAAAACVVPALRASRVNPAETLRSD
jgi:putative ABC transport system permease protein